jgi:predicted Zn finger-like uncharacterized protein
MLLTCPACDTQYKVEEASLDPQGSKVRCFRCSYTWVAKPAGGPPQPASAPQESIGLEEPEAEAEVTPAVAESPAETAAEPRTLPEPEPKPKPEPKPEPKLSAAVAGKELKAEASPAAPAKPAPADRKEPDRKEPARKDALDREHLSALRSKRQMPVWPFYALILLLFGALVVLLYTGREQLSRVHPLASDIYRTFGYEVVLPGDGLSIESIKSVQRTSSTGGELEVVGEVVNVSNRPRLVPGLRLIVLGTSGEELASWTERLKEKALLPKERALFSFSLENPPQGAANVEIEFVALPAE